MISVKAWTKLIPQILAGLSLSEFTSLEWIYIEFTFIINLIIKTF